ncbi:hypothetical protein H7J06_11560 [Mycobacterium hodleri]|uniref:hypothetical protein n=1 Tax=Mycolicibacterium hodleri TaxID=49897 RepID=UPI0021F2E736|nr:hypothetical protein [Mycolicibacterium hodleri]MCV7133623.1 hypothetical protein [Mycolicibacterium hodleri]
MPEMPRDSRSHYVLKVPIDTIQPGNSLVVDRGQGRQLFQVEEVTLHSKKAADGKHATTYTLTSGPVAGGGKPWTMELPAGSTVTRLLGDAEVEEYKRNARNSRYAAGYHYAQLQQSDITVVDQKRFGDLWADRYSAEGLTLPQAWETYKSH